MNLEIAEDLCRGFEGLFLKPYLCPAGIPTIGFGTTRYPNGKRVTLQDAEISEIQALSFLRWELEQTAAGVLRFCPVLATDEKKFNAIVDFAFNMGLGRLQTSTLRRKINEEDWPAAQEQLMKWVYGGGKKLRGLVRRREAECKLFD